MLYKNFNKTLKTTILITLSTCRIIANPNECLTLCCPCLFENDEIEIEKFLKIKSNKNYKKDEIKSEKSLLKPTLENYINAFKDIDNKLGSFFKNNEYVFYKEFFYNHYCIFKFFEYNKKIKDILQVGNYCVTFNTEKNLHFKQDLVDALLIEEDDEIKYLSKEIKNLKEEKMEVPANDVTFFLGSNLYIYSNKDNKYIGGISFQSVNHGEEPLTFNIIYWLNYNYRGLGIMSVIVPTICKYFFTRIKEIKEYCICWDKKNSKSAGLAKKTCNFIRTGHEEEYEIKEEDNEEEGYICITKK